MIGALDNVVMVGCDGKLADGSPCPRIALYPNQPAPDYVGKHLAYHGWTITGEGFDSLALCPVCKPAPPVDGTW